MSVWAFGAGFANAIGNNMERSKDETSAMRRMMIQRYSSMADQYIAEKKKASEVIKTESIYKSMGLPTPLASLAAYSGVGPDKLGEFMRLYEVVDNTNVRSRKDGQLVDVAKMTGSAPPKGPEDVLKASASGGASPTNQAMPGAASTANGGANPQNTITGAGAGVSNQSGGSQPATGNSQFTEHMEGATGNTTPAGGPADAAGGDIGTRISHLLSGRGNMSQAHQTAIRDLSHVYGVSPEQFMQMVSGEGYDTPVPDVTGISPRDPLDLDREDLALRTEFYNQRERSSGRSDPNRWTQSDMNNIATIRAQNKIAELTEDDPDFIDKTVDPKGLLDRYKAQAMEDLYSERQSGANPLMAATNDLIGKGGPEEGATLPDRPTTTEAASKVTSGADPMPRNKNELRPGRKYDVGDGDVWTYLGGDPGKDTSWSK